MPRIFTRQLSFIVEGEIYDNETKPEDIIKNYEWYIKDDEDTNNINLVAHHNDQRGRITKMYKLSKIQKVKKKPDTEYFLV
jgi:hypothetical protein